MIPSVVNTLFINGVEVRVTPTSFDAQPITPPRRIVKLPCGPVEVKWPGDDERTVILSVAYTALDEEDAEAILVLCTMNEAPGGTLRFSSDGPVYHSTQLRCEVDDAERGFDARIDATMKWIPL